MSTAYLIVLSSSESDSDFSLEYISESEDVTPSIGESSHTRKLPHWESADSSCQGQSNAGQFNASSKSSVHVNNSLHSGSNGDTEYLVENGNGGPPRTVNSRIATTAGEDYERLSSQQAFKSTMTCTSQSYAPPTKSNNSVDNLGSVQIRVEAVSFQKSVLSSQYPSDHPYRPTPGCGEELVPGSDERLIYEAALEKKKWEQRGIRQTEIGDKMKAVVFPSLTSNGHSDSASVITSTRDEKPLHYTLQIQSFSLLKSTLARFQRLRYETQTFHAGRYKWKLALYPNGDEKRNVSGHISLYLVMADNAILSTVSKVNAMFTFLVYDNLRDKYLTVQDGKVRRFHAMKTECGFQKLLSLDTFNDASNGFLVDDCCAFGVDIFVMRSNEGKGEVLSLIKQPNSNKYTWRIVNFSKRLSVPIESNVFTVESYNWRICLHSQCQGCLKFMVDSAPLSLTLIFDDLNELPHSFHVYVEYEMAIFSQLGVGLEKVTCKGWVVNGEENGFGSSNIVMSLSDLKNPTKNFICNDTLIVEVKMNAISTLKKLS